MTVREYLDSRDESIRPRLNAVCDPGAAMLDIIRAPAAAEGLFVWSPPQKEG